VLRMTWKVRPVPKGCAVQEINGEGELRVQPSNPGSPGKMAIKTECVCVRFFWRSFRAGRIPEMTCGNCLSVIFFMGRMHLSSPNQQCQCTEGV